MKRLYVVVGVLLLWVPAEGAQRGQAKQGAVLPASNVTSIRVVFSTQDVQLIRAHYAPRYRNLPPGLQKKLARTGSLPPGWQKKLEPFPTALEQRLVRLPDGYSRGVIDGHAVIYRPGGVLIDATVLF